MNVKYEKKPEMTFIGYHTEIRPEEGYQKCPEFWDKEFAAKYARLWQTMKPETEIEKAILENEIGMFAICSESENGFLYWIAGLYKGGDVPEGLELYSFPASDWAIFTAKGPMPGSLQTLNTAVWQEWFPNEGQKFQANGKATLEVYSQGDPQASDYECGIWVPVQTEGKQMHLVQTDDFETVKSKYIEVIENTPDMEKYARWIYGKHPTDESLKAYIDRGEMYVLMDGEEIAGMAAVAMCQGDDYLSISWKEDLKSDEVATVHLLAICPDYRGKALGIKILEDAMEIAVKNGKKALRLDALKSNLPAQKMYEKSGFVYSGEQRLYAENTGMTEFLYYEKIPKEN